MKYNKIKAEVIKLDAEALLNNTSMGMGNDSPVNGGEALARGNGMPDNEGGNVYFDPDL